jgi:hypothetical protein
LGPKGSFARLLRLWKLAVTNRPYIRGRLREPGIIVTMAARMSFY